MAADAKSNSTVDYLDKIRDVTDSFREEFQLGEEVAEQMNNGPPPDMKRRKLIFDSIRTIIEKDAGQGGGGLGGAKGDDEGEDRGRYIYVFGAGYHGQLGRKAARGHKKYANIPIPVHLHEAVRQISCGALHTAVVTDDGKVYTWGDGRMGQLGHLQEGFSNQPVPTMVSALQTETIRYIASGQNHTIALTDTGDAYSWGWAKYGQLGLGTRTNQRYPVQIRCDNSPQFSKIKQVSCGDRHSVCISADGTIFSFGSGEHGQLGHGDNHDQYIPKQIESLKDVRIKHSDCGSIHTAVVSENGELFIFGFGENLYGKNRRNFNYEPVLIPFKHKISEVACGQSHILILCENNLDVYAWGDGSYGEIGQGAFKASQQPRLVLHGKNISSISAGRYHSCAVSNNGALYTWGCGDNGQLARQQDKQDNYSKKANSVPKLVVSLLGNVIGEIACGEHHTTVLASCRYKTLSDDVSEWGRLEEMEFQAKLNLLSSSKQKGRGISKKELIRIRRWRRDEDLRRTKKHEYDETVEAKKIEEQISKIELNDTLRTQIQKEVSSPNKGDVPKSSKSSGSQVGDDKQHDGSANEKDDKNAVDNDQYLQDQQDAAATKLPPVRSKKKHVKKEVTNIDVGAHTISGDIFGRNSNQQNATTGITKDVSGRSVTLGLGENRTSAKVANQARAGFHETGRGFLYTMATNIFGVQTAPEGLTSTGTERREYAAKSKFGYRKEYDKLKLVAAQKEQSLRKLDEELAMLQEVDDCSELQSQAAEMQLRKLGMKLNTVMIKISEAERSRRTYELNITHIKDESQENHKQLDYLRRNLFLQENLKKKIRKFKEYAERQKDFAQLGLKEFMNELDDWKNFLDYQYKNLATLAKSNKENNLDNQMQNNSKEKQVKKQQKAMNRINKLQKLVETNDKEISRLSEKLTGLENQIEFYEDRFRRIYTATGLNDPDKIINKFFVNKEILTEQTKILESLKDTKDTKFQQQEELDAQLKAATGQQIDHTWREVDILQERLQNSENKLIQTKQTNDAVKMKLTSLQQWIIVVLNQINHYINQWEIDKSQHNLPDISAFTLRNKAAMNESGTINTNDNQTEEETDSQKILDILFDYVRVFMELVSDIQNGSNNYKRKELTNEMYDGIYGNSDLNSFNKAKSSKAASAKKKAKKAKRPGAK